ncbi:MAG: EamA family transporter, partial [Oscillospiraceae bacterium]|nr:EamA family transporter [Oscillospiraceae bacterium]
MKKHSSGYGIFLAVLAAALYAINAPFSKILLDFVPPTMMAGLLYIGAGIGMGAVALFRRGSKTENAEKPFTKKQLP